MFNHPREKNQGDENITEMKEVFWSKVRKAEIYFFLTAVLLLVVLALGIGKTKIDITNPNNLTWDNLEKGVLYLGLAICLTFIVAKIIKYLESDSPTPIENNHLESRINLLDKQLSDIKLDSLVSIESGNEEVDQSIEVQVTSEKLNILNELIVKEYLELKKTNLLYTQYSNTIRRLNEAIKALEKKGVVNLVIGIIFALSGLVLLTSFVSGLHDINDVVSFTSQYVPRLTIIIFIQVVSYFFLRLYKSTLPEIKYYQNELTNIEMKHIALITAREFESKETFCDVIKSLSNTERNDKLEKGQSTTEIEKMKFEKDDLLNVIDKILGAIKLK